MDWLAETPDAYALDPACVAELASPELETTLRAELERLFGTPRAPRLFVLEEWEERGFDPARPDVARGHGGSGELAASALAALRADNRRRFADELDDIEDGDLEDVGPWSFAPGLSRSWEELRSSLARIGEPGGPDEAGRSAEERRERASRFLVAYYPSLRDSAALYGRQCERCHGTEGGGDGPGARFLAPPPRDFRRGIFKFTSVSQSARPRREDLHRVLSEGIPRTSMPSFARFSEAELHGLVDYVRLLAIRGRTELLAAGELTGDAAEDRARVRAAYAEVLSSWFAEDDGAVPVEGPAPPPTRELVELGRRLFHDPARGGCVRCHGEEGRGDGVAAFQPSSDGGEPVPAFLDAWGREIEPRDLTRGDFRYGSEEIDLYRRIYAGIGGTPMPALGEARDEHGEPLVDERELWALVHYVRWLGGDLEAGELAPSSTP